LVDEQVINEVSDHIVDALLVWINSPEIYSKMMARARRRAEENFSFERRGREMEEIYRQAVV
jgi:glycosyltransferase involved in cell wall biosynthesis